MDETTVRRTQTILFLCLACGCGCRQEDEGPASAPPPASNPAASQAGSRPTESDQDARQVDQLRALGYIGYSPEKADPNLSGVTRNNPDRACPGYNLYGNPQHCSAYLIDMMGKVIRSWRDPTARRWANCILLPDGDLLAVARAAIPKKDRVADDLSRHIIRFAWSGEERSRQFLPVHHDIKLTSSGQLLTLTKSYRLVPEIRSDYLICDHQLTLLSPEGDILEQRSIYDLLNARPHLFTFETVEPQQKRRTPVIDLIHSNSIEWLRHEHLTQRARIYSLQNVLFCIRNQNAMAIVDWESGELLWSWGQGQLCGPHDATMLENGHILVFDNGRTRGWSRVLEVDPVTDRIVWEYRSPEPTDFFTNTRGSSQRLPNGNTLVVDSDHGRAFEITSDGEIVWEFFNPLFNDEGHRSCIERMKRYDQSYVDAILEASEAPGASR